VSTADAAPPTNGTNGAAPTNGAGAIGAAANVAADERIAGSYHLTLLMKKIDAFAALVEQGKLAPARIIAEDLGAIVAHFDPLLYFPKMFSRYARLMAVHSAALSQIELDPDAPPWKALRALYQVDLDEFLKVD